MGKSAPKAPDYGPTAEASMRAAELGHDLGTRQQEFTEAQWETLSPYLVSNMQAAQANQSRMAGIGEGYLGIASEVSDQQIAQMRQNMEQGADYYDYGKSFRPYEQMMIEDALAYNANDRFANQALASATTARARTRSARENELASMGVNPNATRFQATRRTDDLAHALQTAESMNQARNAAEEMGHARLAEVVGLGRDNPGFSSNAYQNATRAAGVASSGMASAGVQALSTGGDMMNNALSQFTSGMGTAQQGLNYGTGTMMGGVNTQVQGLLGAANGQADVYNNYDSPLSGGLMSGASIGSAFGPLGAVIGGGAGLLAGGLFS